jgi:hypothetical protein
MALVLSLTLGGCAAHRHAAPAPDLHDWASVAAIAAGTPVRVTLDYDIDGRLDEVTGSMLTIAVPPDMHPVRISRGLVARLGVLAPKKMRWGWLGKPLAAGVVGGLVGTLVGAVMRDARVAGISLGIFAASSVGKFYHYVHHYNDHEWRIVYVRP